MLCNDMTNFHPTHGLRQELEEAQRRYWQDGGPGKGSARYWARLKSLGEDFGEQAVQDAREELEREYDGACESVA